MFSEEKRGRAGTLRMHRRTETDRGGLKKDFPPIIENIISYIRKDCRVKPGGGKGNGNRRSRFKPGA